MKEAIDLRGDTAATRRWEEATRWPLALAALAFLLAYTAQVVLDLSGGARTVTAFVFAVTWVAFVVDYVVRLSVAAPRILWFRKHLFDLVIVVLPVLRPIRLLSFFQREPHNARTAGASLRARILSYGITASLLLIWMAALAVLEVERYAPGGTIDSFGIAIWWAFCTVTTVGYGDYTPITVPGRTIAIGLMMGGIVLVGMITATFSSWVVDRVTRGHEAERAATRADIDRLTAQLAATAGPPQEKND